MSKLMEVSRVGPLLQNNIGGTVSRFRGLALTDLIYTGLEELP